MRRSAVRSRSAPPVLAAQRRRLPRRSALARRRAVSGLAQLRLGRPAFAREAAGVALRLVRRSLGTETLKAKAGLCIPELRLGKRTHRNATNAAGYPMEIRWLASIKSP